MIKSEFEDIFTFEDEIKKEEVPEYSGFVLNDIAQGRAHAKEKGLQVVLPRADELQIDLDSEDAVTQFDERFKLVNKQFKLEEISRAASKSGGEKKHVTLRVLETPLTDLLRIALQSILGSDYKRELFSLRNCVSGKNCPTIFFEKII